MFSSLVSSWDTAVIGGALGNIKTDLNGRVLNSVEQEWATAALSCGAIIGTLIGGSYSDKIGRKAVLIIGDVCFAIGAILICASYSLEQFIVGRIVMGAGTGIAAVVCAVYIGEVAPSKLRGRLVGVQSVMITGGQLIAYAVSAGLDNVNGGWRILFALSLPFAIGQGIAMHWLPESPRYALIAGRRDEAERVLRKIYPLATEEELALKLKAIQVMADVSQSLKLKHPSLWDRIRIVFTTPTYFRCVLCASIIFLGQQMSGWNSLLYYSSTLFGAAGFNNPSAVGILVAGVNALMTTLSMFTMDRIGRRRIFLIGVPTMIIALALAAVAFHFMTIPTGGVLLENPPMPYDKKWVGFMLGMVVIFIVGFAPSLGTLSYTTIELIPLEVRGIGSSIAVACQWAGNLIISSTFLSMMNKIGPAGTYGFFAGFGLLTFLWIYFTYPEPSGLTLEQLGLLFTDGFGVRKAEQMRAAQKHRDLEGVTKE
ncbi:MFS transporter, SP family, arabinose:H+ symporter [Pseudohyphozyma bogoriensis]|nr:MFS transporter, SP family, arabinose:H+ symporter [Pseudohyphozyma bogoriensis]